MTIQEMLQEIEQQKLEDLLNGYTDQDFYDDCFTLPEVDYTTQEWQSDKWHSIPPNRFKGCHTNSINQTTQCITATTCWPLSLVKRWTFSSILWCSTMSAQITSTRQFLIWCKIRSTMLTRSASDDEPTWNVECSWTTHGGHWLYLWWVFLRTFSQF